MESKLHIGCFDAPVAGWYNTDITPHLRIARVPGLASLMHLAGKMTDERHRQHRAGVFRQVHYLDITQRFPYPDNTFEGAFSSHVLEHIPVACVPFLFQEVLRVLRPGGIFRVVVPSLEMAIAQYTAESPDRCLDMIFENKHSGVKNIHKWMYTRQSLAKIFERSEYSDVRVESYRTGRLPGLEAIDNRPENSIYVEGQKPV